MADSSPSAETSRRSSRGDPTEPDQPGRDSGSRTTSLATRSALLVAAAVLLFVVLVPTAYRAVYSDQVFPGVSAAGLSLGGATLEEAADRIATGLPALESDVTLRDPIDGREWSFSSEELGLVADSRALAEEALSVGRSGVSGWLSPLRVLVGGTDVLSRTTVFDEQRARATLEDLAPDVDVPPINAAAQMRDGRLVVQEPELGRQLDLAGSIERLERLAHRPVTTTVDIAVLETAPRVGDADQVAAAYERIVSKPVHVVWEADLHEILEEDQLAEWASVESLPNEAGDPVPSIVIDYDGIGEWVLGLADRIQREPENARFRYETTGGQVKLLDAGRTGIVLDVFGTVERIVEAAYNVDRTASPAVEVVPPRVPASALSELVGIVELARSSTSIEGAPEGRLRNLLVATERLNGVAVPPSSELSLNAVLGEVSEEAGFRMPVVEAEQVIPGSREGDLMGGIEQLATSVFRAALWSGLPVLERHAPVFRAGWLEPPVGLDAVVSTTDRDLRIANDTAGYLLMQVYLDAERGALSCVIYGKPDERTVELAGPRVSDVVPALTAVLSVPDSSLGAGQRQQVVWAREGATAAVEYTVTVGSLVRTSDSLSSEYLPSADVVLEQPGE